MKVKKLTVILMVLFFSSNVFAASLAPIISKVPVIGVYSPMGFDSNDNVEVMIEGYLPNLCYKSPMLKSKVDGKKINITVEAYRANQKGLVCLEMIVPFVERVSLGILDKADYKVFVNKKAYSDLSILKATSPLIDENIYANVNNIEQVEGVKRVVLKGYNPSDCLELDKIKVVSNGSNVYSILPIMKKVRELCSMKMVPFSYEVEIPEGNEASKVLLHVRAMDGRSINALYNYAMNGIIGY